MTKCIGASIVTFAVCPRTHGIFFLLGKEKFCKTWPSDSEKWSDFGGRRKTTDDDACEIAAREFWEETIGCVRYFNHDETVPRRGYKDITESLRKKEYVCKFSFAIGKDCEYVTYLKQIPLQPEVPDIFKYTRRSTLRKTKQADLCDFLEKTKICWFGLPRIATAVRCTPVLKVNTFEREYIRRWFRDRMRFIIGRFQFTCSPPGRKRDLIKEQELPTPSLPSGQP